MACVVRTPMFKPSALVLVVAACVSMSGCGPSVAHPRSSQVPSPATPSHLAPSSSAPAQADSQASAPLACPAEPTEGHSRREEAAALEVEWFEAPNARTIERCATDSPDHDVARSAFAALDAAVTSSPRDGDGSNLRTRLQALLALRCFAPAVEASLPPVRSARSFQEWWSVGGKRWLEQYLEPLPARSSRDSSRRVFFPPEERSLLSAGDRPAEHYLAPVLCHATDETCGAATEPFIIRALQSFESFRLATEHHLEEQETVDERGMRDSEQRGVLCGREARRAPARDRYGTWYGCIQAHQETGATFPIDRIQVPERGWIVLSGRRGHYNFCDEVRAYDLATGAAYIAQSCSDLALRQDGSVDGRATNQAREETVLEGRLPLFALRELAWMLLIADEIENEALIGDVAELPDGIEPVLQTEGELMGTISGVQMGSSSAQTRVRWSWIIDGCVRRTNHFTFPNSFDNAAINHIDELLVVAEAGFERGCVPAALPAELGETNDLERLLRASTPTLCPTQ